MEFYKETEFRDTDIGRIPKEWELKTAEEICSKVTDGTHDTPKPSESGFFLVTSKNIKERGLDLSGSYLISEKDFKEVNKRSKVALWDVLFSMIGTLGATVIIDEACPEIAIKNVGLFKTNNNEITARWLHYYFNSDYANDYINANKKATTQQYLPLYSLRSFPIILPKNEKEKRAIVLLLKEVDSLIQQTDSIIQKTQKLKKGLMQELLTKGIGHKEFKYSKELGYEMPKEWEAKKIVDLFDVETGTTPSTKDKSFWEEGTINWITPTDLSKLNDEINITISERKITEKAVKECSLSMLPKDSIILSTRAPVGYVAVLNQKSTFNQGCKGLIPRTEYQIDSKYYCYFLISRKDVLENYSGGSTFKELSKQWLEYLSVPYLSFKEQQLISNILMNIDNNMEKEKKTKAELEILKKGLMQSLLTGQVRIKVN